MHKLRGLIIATIALFCFTLSVFASESNTVITAIPAAKSLADSLLKDTGIKTYRAVPEGTTMNRIAVDKNLSVKVKEAAISADAIIHMASFWGKDRTYGWARRSNIFVVPIDCMTPMDGVLPPSVPIISGEGIPMPWITYPGINTMACVIARDLKKVYPEQASQIERNLKQLKDKLIELDLKWQELFMSIENPYVVSLRLPGCDLFEWLGLMEIDSFDGDPFYWNEETFKKLERLVKKYPIITTREPAGKLADFLRKNNTQLIVLDDFDSFEEGQSLIEAIESNLEKIYHIMIKGGDF